MQPGATEMGKMDTGTRTAGCNRGEDFTVVQHVYVQNVSSL